MLVHAEKIYKKRKIEIIITPTLILRFPPRPPAPTTPPTTRRTTEKNNNNINIMVNEEDRTVTVYISVVKAIYTYIFFSSLF